MNLRRTTLLSTAVMALAGCTVLTPERTPPPETLHAALLAEDGKAPFRFWGDEPPPEAARIVASNRQQLLAAYEAAGRPEEGLTTAVLALSGGAWDGAYGAGVLTGWTACGARPAFRLVTGVSTGALLAPFAFLGSDYDEAMRAAFTAVEEDQVLILKPLRALFGALSLADTAPLAATIQRFATQAMLDAIGTEHRRGRTLLIGTTHLDAERPVIWDIGALAMSGRPDRLQLFRDIVLASASVPGAFPPVMFDTNLEGERFQEMHVDGGVTNSVFVLPLNFDVQGVTDLGFPHRVALYILQNNKLGPQAENVPLGLGAIVARSISALIRAQSRGDAVRLYFSAQRRGFAFHLGAIPDDFAPGAGVEEGFNARYMGALFDAGYEEGRQGYRWRTAPPGLTAPGETATRRTLCRGGADAPALAAPNVSE